MKQNISIFRKSSLVVFFPLILLSGGLYLNSLNNTFTNWDDIGLILNNQRIRILDWQNIKEIFALKKASTYQPIRMLSYAVDYYFWKLNPMGYRITNIIFYMLTCIMVFLTLKILSTHLREKVSGDSHFRVALFGSLIFAAHPVHVEAVTWLAARKEVLQGFFFFLSLYLYLKGREERGKNRAIYLSLVLFSFLLAILSKPSAVVFPAVILLYELTRKKDSIIMFLRSHWFFFTLAVILSGIFTFVLMKVMLDSGGIKPYYGKTFLENGLVVLYAFLRSIKLLSFTVNYSAAYSFSIPLPVYHIKNIIFTSITIALFVLSFWSLKRTRAIFFSLFFFLITMLPFLNIIPIITLLADRYVFIASFSYVFLLGILFDRFYHYNHKRFSWNFFKILSLSIFLFLLIGYSYMTVYQNTIWRNSYTLWADAVEKNPESNTANALMGVVYMELGMDEEAVKYLEKAVQILPYDYQSRNNLGIVYGRMGQPEKALKELAIAHYLQPDNDHIKINLSILFQRQKEYQKAEEILKGLISKNGNNANLRYRLAMLYKEMGQDEMAISELRKTSELAPHIINPYEELGNIYASKLNDREKAIYYYSKGIEMAPKAKERIEELRWIIQDLER
uniref:Tetratricopeptide repeat protein n=1 Tax=candidate division CPR3 bacterium TaxID=2268181 RepID=A0A7V3N685_UNCC3